MATRKAKQAEARTPKAADVPVTRAMLGGMRNELLARMDEVQQESRAEIAQVKAQVARLGADVAILRSEVTTLRGELASVRTELKADIAALRGELKADIAAVKASVGRIEFLVEEQNARNKVVLDGITALLGRQNQVEERVERVEATVRRLAAP